MIECLSDNRTVPLLKCVMHSANVAVTSVRWFRSLSVQQKRRDLLRERREDTIMEAALEAGAEDVVTYETVRLMSTLHGKKWAKYATL